MISEGSCDTEAITTRINYILKYINIEKVILNLNNIHNITFLSFFFYFTI